MQAGTIQQTLDSILDSAARESGCRGLVVTRRDGLVVASHRLGDADPRVACAQGALLVGVASTTADQLRQGALEEVIVRSSDGVVLAVQAGEDSILVAFCDPEANLGLVRIALARAAEGLAKALETWMEA